MDEDAERFQKRLALALHAEYCQDPKCGGARDYMPAAKRIMKMLGGVKFDG